MPARRLHLSLALAALGICWAAIFGTPTAGAASSRSASPAAPPLYVEDPAGPIELTGPPSSLISSASEGFTSGEGWGSVLVGYDARKGSEILWNTPRGLFFLSGYHAPPGPGLVSGDSSRFGVIEAPRRVVRLYEGSDGRYRQTRVVETGTDPVALILGYGTLTILNRGSADLWYYELEPESEGHRAPVVKVPLGGDPTDAVGSSPDVSPMFVSDISTDSVTELDLLREGSFQFRRSIPVGSDPVDLALGQFLPDREPEVAVANRGSDTVSILDSATIEDPGPPEYTRVATYPAGDEPVAVRAVNIDGEKGADLAIVDAGSDRLTVLLNDGHGHLHRVASYKTGRDPVAVSPVDTFDRTFGPDLVVANHGSKSLTVFLRHYSGLCRGREAQPSTGTDGDDALLGGRGVDMMRGLAGDDRVFGNGSGDCLYGGSGDDYMLGKSGGDLIDGGPGNDRLDGGLPEYRGNRGRDTIIGGPGHDTIQAGWADDVVRAADGERDFVNCGVGDDVAYVDPIDVVRHCEHVHVVD